MVYINLKALKDLKLANEENKEAIRKYFSEDKRYKVL